jgi:hypothetical protein
MADQRQRALRRINRVVRDAVVTAVGDVEPFARLIDLNLGRRVVAFVLGRSVDSVWICFRLAPLTSNTLTFESVS